MENNVDKINELLLEPNSIADPPCDFLNSVNYPLNVACYFNNLHAVINLVQYGANIESECILASSWTNKLSNLEICKQNEHKEIHEFLSVFGAMTINKKYIDHTN